MSKKHLKPYKKELILIYNADSDFFSRISDFAHKTLSPKTYSCSLCKLTYGSLTMHHKWSEFLKGMPMEISFEYKDTWKGKEEKEYPLILMREGINKKVMALPEEINKINTLDELMDLIRARCK